ncbi:hypothetical protein CCR75_004068 [Bremia lactucae]|uniref:RNA polymerase I-specific transcription initiation factor RRN3 n=1 Tax=Bremia lactucae TaxID=4779 RepID=A0A976NYP3_BRELC|nr:hypothetical protein CCR75_004068 [Bremia lactucae]
MAGCAMSLRAVSVTPTEEEVANMHQFIENALDLVIKGNTKSYQYLIQQLTVLPPPIATRRKILRALLRCISTIARDPQAYRVLLDVLFKFDLLASGDVSEAEDYATFIIHLVSSNTTYVWPTLHMLARNMGISQEKELPPDLRALGKTEDALKNLSYSTASGSLGSNSIEPGTPVLVTKEPSLQECILARYAAAHQMLERIITLVPTASNVLFPILCEHFPHKRMDAPTQVAYLRNVLRITEYVGGLRERVLGLVIDQLVAIDVEIKLDESEEDVFTMDDFLDDNMLAPDDASQQVDKMADKLDQMMLVMFKYIEECAASSSSTFSTGGSVATIDSTDGEVDIRQAALVFKYLLKVFEHSILNTHRSKYPQFLLFYVCRIDPQFQDIFISQLLAASLDPQTPATMRQSCGAYLASFLARAKYISVAYLQKALYHLLKWLHDQMDIYDETLQEQQRVCDPYAASEIYTELRKESQNVEITGAHGFQENIFVSSLQTVCYMLCFRGLEIAISDNGTGYEFLRSLGWERLLITSDGYCPLAYCQQTVATEFLNLAEAFDLVSDECLERVDQAIGSASVSTSKSSKSMERSKKPTSGSSTATTLLDQRQPLETFFPFDPYLLRRSFQYIGPLYLYWKHADPTSPENCKRLESVKDTIRLMRRGAHIECYGSEEEEGTNDDDTSVGGSASIPINFTSASYDAESHMGSLDRDYTSPGSSYDMKDHVDDRVACKRSLPSRCMFNPSPALSASSPPSRLPPLGATNAFILGGFDGDEDDGF